MRWLRGHIHIVCAGKLKEKFWVAACTEYMKRMANYAEVSITKVVEEKAPEQLSELEEIKIKEKEGQRLLAALRADDYVVALAFEGQSWSSEQLAVHIDQLTTYGKSSLVFLIGGSLGLAESVMSRADCKLSFSKITFPHQLMWVILLKQVYRAFRIMRGHAYHK
jgi:23S rRNA (pseudouridine1915-N3)-methyltransferase